MMKTLLKEAGIGDIASKAVDGVTSAMGGAAGKSLATGVKKIFGSDKNKPKPPKDGVASAMGGAAGKGLATGVKKIFGSDKNKPKPPKNNVSTP